MSRNKTLALGLVGAGLALGAAAAAPASAHDSQSSAQNSRGSVRLAAELNPLNNSGVEGMAVARVTGGDVLRRVVVQAHGLSPDAPHAMHIHYGEQAENECPTFRDDANDDNRLNTVEGVPQYGPIAISLTTTGDTSAEKSALALDRMPVSKDGHLSYARNNIAITGVTDVDGAKLSARHVSDAIRAGEGVVVIHGIDYNEDGEYSLSEEGASELDPSGATPAEATDPAACGVLVRH